MRKQVTFYDTLGVERDAPDHEVRGAFRRLALKYHPDRYSDSQRADAEERFQGITEAFNVLSHPESREKYDKELSQGTDVKSMDAKEISRRLAAKGAQLMREGKMAEAVECLKTAVDHDDDNARAHYFYAQVLARISGKERDALRHVEKAVSLESGNATMKAEAATLSMAAGMKTRALRHAQQALRLDPTNVKATKVINELEGEENGKGGSLLGRLRGKS
ncbi:MAG: DnaJ domain-containing protein [Acidobacteriota bacterium]|jgi:curved DNA-binding protein CbpA|nr:DnaJ domain-containing protein [Acidobacteriota bacterium]